MAVHEFPRPNSSPEPRRRPKLTERRARLADFDLRETPVSAAETARVMSDGLIRPRAVLEAVAQMNEGESVRLEFRRLPEGWSFELAAMRAGHEPAEANEEFQEVIRAMAPRARFCSVEPRAPACARVVKLAPRPMVVAGASDKPLWLPPLLSAEADLTLALEIAFKLQIDVLAFEVRRVALDDALREHLVSASYRLWEKGGDCPAKAAAQRLIDTWLALGRGCSVEVLLAVNRRLGAVGLDALSLALFGCARQAGGPQHGLDLRLAFPSGALPLWRFWPSAADLRRYDRFDLDVPAGNGALTLGVDAAGRPVRISSGDRGKHIYTAGRTGSGKSTFFGNACREDIINGEGVLLIDPHGDLARSVRQAVPSHRQRDLIWIDLGSADLAWRLDLFKTPGIFPDAERARIADQLIAYFRQIWRGTPEAFGPAFENLFSGATQLLHSARDEADRTLLKFRKVLVDDAFRRKLLEECDDEALLELWEEIHDVSGEWQLSNLAPYITCKLSRLLNPLTRRFVGGDKPRLDLRQAMDERKIVIVNLNAGVVGESAARFIGALIFMAVSEAAMGRCRVDEAERIPFRVYIDEFQTMVSDVAASALAQCRKYNLSLVLANQNLGQLRGDWYQQTDVSETVLSNCNTLIAFRLGMHDAKLLAPAFGLEHYRDLTELGVGEMIVSRIVDGVPVRAQRVFGLPPIAPPSDANSANDR
ncbi:MAG: type IV secretory system conjugative DNA transfer family protein [Hyphomonadaceae bacterium]